MSDIMKQADFAQYLEDITRAENMVDLEAQALKQKRENYTTIGEGKNVEAKLNKKLARPNILFGLFKLYLGAYRR
jgi:hypothetical protein